MEKLRNLRKHHLNEGSMWPLTVFFIIIIMLLCSAIFSYLQCWILSKQITESLQLAANSVAEESYDRIYADIRVAYSAAIAEKGEEAPPSLTVPLDESKITTAFSRNIGSEPISNGCALYDRNGNPIYEVKDINGKIETKSFYTTAHDNLIFPITVNATAFIYPGGILSGGKPIRFTASSTAHWTPRF